jgi:hypothetical protein
MLTHAAQVELKLELRRLRSKLASLHEQSVPAPLMEKHGIGLILAIRRWEPSDFRRLRRAAPDSSSERDATPRPSAASLGIGISGKRNQLPKQDT